MEHHQTNVLPKFIFSYETEPFGTSNAHTCGWDLYSNFSAVQQHTWASLSNRSGKSTQAANNQSLLTHLDHRIFVVHSIPGMGIHLVETWQVFYGGRVHGNVESCKLPMRMLGLLDCKSVLFILILFLISGSGKILGSGACLYLGDYSLRRLV